MAKLCRHHQKQIMSVLSYMRSEASPALEPLELSARKDMVASSPAPVQQQPESPEDPTGSRSASQSQTSSNREAPSPSELNCTNSPEEKRPTREETLPVGTEASGAASVETPAARDSCSSGTCIKNCTVGAWSSSIGACTSDCNKTGSVETLQQETVNWKEMGDSQLGQPSSECAHISTVTQIEEVSSISQLSKAESAVAAKAQNLSFRAFPMELLNLSKKLAKNQSCPAGGPGVPLVHDAMKHTTIQGGSPGSTNATKRSIKGNHVLPAGASAKDCWFVSKPRPAVRDTNGRLRLKAQAPPTKTARKSTRVSVLRARSSMSTVCQYVNEHDNQCDIVYISKPITECRFDARQSLSSTRKTARKSTRGHLCNEEYWELQTVRTLARSSAMEARKGNCPPLITKPPAPVTLKQALTLPVSIPAIGIPVGASAGVHGGSKVQLKVLVKQGQSQELEESQDLQCSASEGQLALKPSQTCPSQAADAPPGKADALQGEPKRPGDPAPSSSSKSHSAEIKSVPLSDAQASDRIATRADCRAHGAGTSDACESAEPSSTPLKECRKTRGSPSKPGQLVADGGDMEDKSTTEGSPSGSEPSPPSQSQGPPVSSFDEVGISPVNSIQVNTVLSLEQCNKHNSGSSDVLNGDEAMSSLTAGDWQAVDSIQSHEGKAVKSLTENKESNRSGQTLSFPTEATACSVMPKEDPGPQIASGCMEASCRSDPAEPTPEPMKGTDGVKCNMASGEPRVEERRLEDLAENATDREREAGSGSGRSPESEKRTSPRKEKALSPAVPEKKKQRKKLQPASSDRCLRSRQPPAQTAASPGDVQEEPLPCGNGLLVPCLSVKLRKSKGERGYKRDVSVNRVTSVQFPTDCFYKVLLQSIADPESRVDESLAADFLKDPDRMRKPTAKKLSKCLPAKNLESSGDEGLADDDFTCESTNCGQGRILEICVDTKSAEERKVSFSVEKAETALDPVSSDGAAGDPAPAARPPGRPRKADAHKENPKWARGGLVKRPANSGSAHQSTKGTAVKVPPGDKKAVDESHDLRCPNVSITEPETTEVEEDSECLNINLSTQVLLESEDCETVSLNDDSEASRPKFLDWCSEDENQELITTLNAKYENLHKAWIQIEKEGPVMQKVKCKSDRLKEIWKSKKRARKARGLYDHKISPVQKLFVANFNFANICKWFMETTETRSLVIVKNVSARNPVETLKTKTFLQQNSLVGLFPSPQAERLKKHLKKFAVASPARNNWKTRALLDHAQRGGMTGAGLQQWDVPPDAGGGLAPRDLFLAKVRGGLAEEDGPLGNWPGPQPSKHLGLKKPVSAWILRKYSNMRGKLQKLQHGKEQAARKHPAKHKSVCMNPLVSPKLTSQTQLDSRGAALSPIPRRAEDRKAKGKASKASPVKEPRAGRGRSSKSEAGPPALPAKPVPKQLPANRKTKVEAGVAKPPAPKKSGGGGKANVLSPKGAEKKLPGAAPKSVAKGKSQPQVRVGAKGKKAKSKAVHSGKERRTKPAKKVAAASAKRRDKTATKKKSKAAAPAKRKREVAPEAPRKKKRKLNEKKDPVPNKRKRTDAK